MKFLNYDGVTTLWGKIKAYVLGETAKNKSIDGSNGVQVDIAATVTPLERYRDANMTSRSHSSYREYRFSAEGVKKLVVRVGVAKGTLTNGFTFVVFNNGTTNTAAPGATIAAGTTTSAATYYNVVLDVPEGTKNIYVSNRPSTVSSPYIRAIYEEPKEGVTHEIYSMVEPYIADTSILANCTKGSIPSNYVITSQTAAEYRLQTVNLANVGVVEGEKLFVRAVFNRDNPLSPRIGFSNGNSAPAVGDTLMEDGRYEFLGANDDAYRDVQYVIVVPEGATFMVAYAYYSAVATPCYLQVSKLSDDIEERATVLESKTTYLYSGVLAQGKRLHFPAGAIGKATIWNGFPYDGECGTMREILIGYDPDGAALGGTAGVYRVIRDAAIDTTVDPDDAVTISIASDCVEIEAVDGTSYYSVLSTIEPTITS